MVDIFMYIHVHVCRSLAFQPIDILHYRLSIYCSIVGIFQLPKTVLTQHKRKLDRVSSHRVSAGGRHFPNLRKNNTCGDENSSFA